jgi:hypothetical protein
MLRKITFALVAAASLSAMALAPSAASAKPWGNGGGWGGGHHRFGGFGGFGLGLIGADSGCFVQQSVPTRYGYTLQIVNVCGY